MSIKDGRMFIGVLFRVFCAETMGCASPPPPTALRILTDEIIQSSIYSTPIPPTKAVVLGGPLSNGAPTWPISSAYNATLKPLPLATSSSANSNSTM